MNSMNPPTNPQQSLPLARKTHKYTEEQKIFIIQCIGSFMTAGEITEAFKSRYGIIQSFAVLKGKYASTKRWQGLLEKTKAEYLANIHESPGFHKRVRLDRLERIYEKARANGDAKIQLSAIEQMRREFEKHESSSIVLLQQQYNFMSDDEIAERKRYLLDKLGSMKAENAKELPDGASRISIEEGTKQVEGK